MCLTALAGSSSAFTKYLRTQGQEGEKLHWMWCGKGGKGGGTEARGVRPLGVYGMRDWWLVRIVHVSERDLGEGVLVGLVELGELALGTVLAARVVVQLA